MSEQWRWDDVPFLTKPEQWAGQLVCRPIELVAKELAVLEAARRVATNCWQNMNGEIAASFDDMLALRSAVRALDGGERRRLRDEDSGDLCQCPEHRYSEG